MKHGRSSSSSDEEDTSRSAGYAPGPVHLVRGGSAFLERCAPADVDASRAAGGKGEGEGVFEIRDFTTASSFERIAHQITLAAKKWAGMLRTSADSDNGQLMREEFDHMDFKYELLFQLVQQDSLALAGAMPVSKAAPPDRLGLHSFPTRAHRLQRWFGVNHFVIVSVRDQNIDLDSARTVLSALVLAVQSVASSLAQPLSCFIPVDGDRRRRYLGELMSGGRRTVYTTDLSTSVQPNLEHLEGLQEFFQQKLGPVPAGLGQALMIGARFTYLVDAFDNLPAAPSGSSEAPAQQAPAAPPAVDGDQLDRDESDPVESMQLYCLWPSFPQGSFIDNAVFSELDPLSAPYWKVRVFRIDGVPLRLTRSLRALLEFRKESRAVRSAEQSVQPQLPKTALGSLSHAIQESLESILLPDPGEMKRLVEECLACPVVTAAPPAPERPATELQIGGLRGGSRGTRLTKFAEHASRMRCFKGCVILWCQVLARMRRQWETLEPPLPSEAPPRTHRVGARGVRVAFFEASCCLAQQKFEMLQRSLEARRGSLPPVPGLPVPAGLKLQATGAAVAAPLLLQPALMTEDMVMQQDMAAASISDPYERAQLHFREMHADMAAFKAANPGAELADFLAWRVEAEHLSLEPFPSDWLERVWQEAAAQPAREQEACLLFAPEREAEMALHYLENIDGPQLLLQIFRVQLCATLEDLSSHALLAGSGHLRMLRDRAVAAALSAFGRGHQAPRGAEPEDEVDAGAAAAVGEVAEFPPEERLEAALAAMETLEATAQLAASLSAKLPGAGLALVEELLVDGEAAVSSHAQRHVVEALFQRGRVMAQCQGREPADAKGIFEALPLAKEFVLLLQPGEGGAGTGAAGDLAAAARGARRLYAEIRERHLRLAIARTLQIT